MGLVIFATRVILAAFIIFRLSGVTKKVVIRGSREEAFKKKRLRIFWRVFVTNINSDLTEVLINEN
jgi:hypothetical protein